MPGRPPHLLIFEPDPRGHAQEWIEHLIASSSCVQRSLRLSVLVADELADRLKLIDGRDIRIVRLSETERQQCLHRRLAISGFARWRAMRRHLRQLGASHGLFLSIDHLSLPLGVGLPMEGRAVSGILFRPSVHYGQFLASEPTWREWLRERRKDVLYGGMLSNPGVHCVLSLDPYFPTYAAHRYRRGDKVVALSDPAFLPPEVAAAEEKLAGLMPRGRLACVLFGELTERKGVLRLLQSLCQLPSATAARMAVMLAGRVDPSLRARVNFLRNQLVSSQPDLWLHVEDRRLTAGEIAAVIRRSDVVLAPYQRFVGSSGALLWAARMGRPVICQEYGLVGQLAREHALGLAVNTSDPKILAGALLAVAARGPGAFCDPGKMAAFASAHSPMNFAQTVLKKVLRPPSAQSAAASTAARGLFAD